MYINADILIQKWFWIPYTNSNAQYEYVDVILGTKYFLTNSIFVLKRSVRNLMSI